MVMIPRQVYEHMRALQQQVTELRLQLARRQAAEPAGAGNAEGEVAAPIERQEDVTEPVPQPPAEDDQNAPPIETHAEVAPIERQAEDDQNVPPIERQTEPELPPVPIERPAEVVDGQAVDNQDVAPIERQEVDPPAVAEHAPAQGGAIPDSAGASGKSEAPAKKKRTRVSKKAPTTKKAPAEEAPAKAKNSKK
jgi:hypothetical protein